MTQYQRACYSLLYLLPKSFILGENSSIYAADKNTFIKNLEVVQKPLEKISGGTQVYTAITEVWNWHWDNWETTRILYNPFESYEFTELNITANDTELQGDTRSGEITGDAGESPANPADKDIADPPRNIRGELSSPDNFLKMIGDNKITLIIFIIAGITLFIVICRNRKKNLEKNEENI